MAGARGLQLWFVITLFPLQETNDDNPLKHRFRRALIVLIFGAYASVALAQTTLLCRRAANQLPLCRTVSFARADQLLADGYRHRAISGYRQRRAAETRQSKSPVVRCCSTKQRSKTVFTKRSRPKFGTACPSPGHI
jgi:hypothetical protein